VSRLTGLVLLAVCALGCSDGITIPDGAGALKVKVRLHGPPATPTSGELRLFLSEEAFENGDAAWLGTLTGGPDEWHAEGVFAPGTYYMWACFDFGCGEYRTPTGEPRPIEVEEGETTEVEAAF
jgi:hypothetical protein